MAFIEEVNGFFGDVTELTSSLFDNASKVTSSLQNFASSLTNAELTGTKPKEVTTIGGTQVDSNMLLIAGAGIVGIFAIIALVRS